MKSRLDLIHAFDQQRSQEGGVIVDTGVVTKRTFDEHYAIHVAIETGVAAGYEVILRHEDFPGTSVERVLFYNAAAKGKRVSLKIRLINTILIRANAIAVL
jgi:hypothetical protein